MSVTTKTAATETFPTLNYENLNFKTYGHEDMIITPETASFILENKRAGTAALFRAG